MNHAFVQVYTGIVRTDAASYISMNLHSLFFLLYMLNQRAVACIFGSTCAYTSRYCTVLSVDLSFMYIIRPASGYTNLRVFPTSLEPISTASNLQMRGVPTTPGRLLRRLASARPQSRWWLPNRKRTPCPCRGLHRKSWRRWGLQLWFGWLMADAAGWCWLY